MDGFSYTDIFSTKGIEYLVIIAFLILLIPFSILLNRQPKPARQFKTVWGALTSNILKIPEGLFFAPNHTWMFMEKNGLAKVGLDDFLMHLTGNVKVSFIRSPGEFIRKGELLTEINQNGKVLQIVSPVTGRIDAANLELTQSADWLNDDPYGKGWIYQIKPENWISESQICYFAEDVKQFFANELNRFREFAARVSGVYSVDTALVVMQDGGEICDHSLSALPDEVWKEFQHEFLNVS